MNYPIGDTPDPSRLASSQAVCRKRAAPPYSTAGRQPIQAPTRRQPAESVPRAVQRKGGASRHLRRTAGAVRNTRTVCGREAWAGVLVLSPHPLAPPATPSRPSTCALGRCVLPGGQVRGAAQVSKAANEVPVGLRERPGALPGILYGQIRDAPQCFGIREALGSARASPLTNPPRSSPPSAAAQRAPLAGTRIVMKKPWLLRGIRICGGWGRTEGQSLRIEAHRQ
jgi:hypothetical protein